MSSQPGASPSTPSLTVTSASIRSPATTVSTSRIERSCPIASGVIDCGKTTVSFSGSTASVEGIAMSGAAGSAARSVTIGCGVASAEPANAEPGVASATPGRVAWSPEDGDGDRVALRLRWLLRQRQLDRQDAALVARLRAVRVDVVRQGDPPLEGPVLDLDLLVGRLPVHDRAAALAGDDQGAFADLDARLGGVDPGDLEDHDELLAGAEAVDVRPDSLPRAREARHLPEILDQLLDRLEPVDVVVPTARHRPKPIVRVKCVPMLGTGIGLILTLVSAAALNLAYVVEHEAARTLPPLSARHPLRSIRLLLSNRQWVGGFATEGAAWALYVVALALAPLALVQAVSAGGIGVLAVLVSRLTRTRLHARERMGVWVAILGLGLLGISLAGGSTGDGSAGSWLTIWLWIGASAGAAFLVGRFGMRLFGGGASWGIATGILFAAGDVTTKTAVHGGSRLLFV